jgi:hypothetical protein
MNPIEAFVFLVCLITVLVVAGILFYRASRYRTG